MKKKVDGELVNILYASGDVNLVQLANLYGVSRQAIDHHITSETRAEREVVMMRIRAEKGERRLWERLAARMRLALDNDRICVVCDCWNLRGPKQVTCSSECAKAYLQLRSFDDYQNHRNHLAKTILNKPGAYKPAQIKWAKAMLSDDPPPPNRRFLIPGSKRAELIKKYRPEAYAELTKEGHASSDHWSP